MSMYNTPQEIADDFPTAKPVVKALVEQREAFLEETRKCRDEIREWLSIRVPMYELEICADLIMAARYGDEIQVAQQNLVELKRILLRYEPRKHQVSGSITDEDIERAREYPIRALIKVNLASKASCPFHNEKTASMHVYKDNHAYCFGCSTRADVIDIYMKLNDTDFITTVKALI